MTFSPESELGGYLREAGVIAVIVIEDAGKAVPLARALLDGGIHAMELTLRTPMALTALRSICQEVPDMIAGVGTVLTTSQVDAIIEAGARFGVAPGCNPAVIKHAQDRGLAFAPGICTATDIECALSLNCRLLKFFPAEAAGGLKLLKNMATPYAHLGLKYIPLGGINTANLKAYLSEPLIHAVGGSWLAPKERVAASDWASITATAQEAMSLVRELRDSAEKG